MEISILIERMHKRNVELDLLFIILLCTTYASVQHYILCLFGAFVAYAIHTMHIAIQSCEFNLYEEIAINKTSPMRNSIFQTSNCYVICQSKCRKSVETG